MKLYTYFRSSAAYRVRIALKLKNIDYEPVFVHLVRDGGQQFDPSYLKLNPQGLVPTLVDGDLVLTQSLPIIQYLEEVRPEPRLLPADSPGRARVRGISVAIACEIHPLNNLRVLTYLTEEMNLSDDDKAKWYGHWVDTGFAAIERMLSDSAATGAFCHGDTPTMADACLVPQIANARRFNLDLSAFPTATRIAAHCLEFAAFRDAAPENQPDAA